MNIHPLYTRQESTDDGVVVQTSWGYCREQNAVRLGYAVNVLAALVGLLSTFLGRPEGLWICLCVGASFGVAYFSEQLPMPWRQRLALASVGFTVCAYAVVLLAALVEL